MEVFYRDNMPSIHLEWEVTRGRTLVREDFSHAEVWVFLTGDKGLIPLSVETVDNVIKSDLPMELAAGEYGVKAIWVKDGTGSKSLDELLACNKRCMSEVFGVFGVSDSPYSDFERGDVTLKIRSNVATYGYDGLSAYERAVMLGKTIESEDDWLVTPSDIPELAHRVSEIESQIGDIPSQEDVSSLQRQIDALVSDGAEVSLSVSPAAVFADGEDHTVRLTATSSKSASVSIEGVGSADGIMSKSFDVVLNSPAQKRVTYRATFTISGLVKGSKSASVLLVWPVYYGAGATLSAAEMTKSNTAQATPSGTYRIATDEGDHLYFEVPEGMRVSKVELVDNPSFPTELSFHTVDGGHSGYTAYETAEERGAGTHSYRLTGTSDF